MASPSKDTSHDESARPGEAVEESAAQAPGEGETVAEYGPASPASHEIPTSDEAVTPTTDHAAGPGKVEDQALIELLEQLNETLDCAQSALSEHHMLASEIAQPEPHIAPDAAPLPPAQATPSSLTPLLAAGLGVGIGAVGLALLWPVWNPAPLSQAQGVPAVEPAHETRAAQGMHVAPPAGAKITPGPLADASAPAGKAPDRLPGTAWRTGPAATAAGLPDAITVTVTADAAGTRPDKQDFEDKDDSMLAPATQPRTEPQPEQSLATALEDKPAPPPMTQEEAALFLTRGNALLGDGDVASARLVFEHAAVRGSADAMFALARTFDPRFLKQHGAVGIRPDVNAALDWYRQAAAHGHDQADAMASELETQAKR